MKIEKINLNLICDTISCWQVASYKLTTNSFKGNMYLCEKCLQELIKSLKGIKKNEAK